MHGGEVFVPKIPSMRVSDLARALAPHLPQRAVGIRPGEKLHEVLLTEDEARSTYEFKDNYVITPTFSFWSGTDRPEIASGGTAVAEEFRYASNTNPLWLGEAELKALIGGAA
jgi:UDP-N-acetylglucosamine 4,6-dehydratase